MMLLISKLLALLLTVPLLFDDRPTFEVAVPVSEVESFESEFATDDSVSFDLFTVTEVTNPSSEANIKWRDDYFSDGGHALGFTWNGNGMFTFEFPQPIQAFGADVLDFGTLPDAIDLFVSASNNGTSVLSNQVVLSGTNPDRGNYRFFGITSSTPFTELVFSSNPASTNDLINFDRVAVSVVPEPTAFAMLMIAAGLATGGHAVRSRRLRVFNA